ARPFSTLNSFHRPSFASRFNSNSSVSVLLPFTRSKPRRGLFLMLIWGVLKSRRQRLELV
ncbi:hypothetical protein LINPERHAP2_LOCUS33047, partial [Linum perenne]